MLKNSFIVFLGILLLVSCSRKNSDNTIPQREGFPRVEALDTLYREVSDGTFTFKINRQTTWSTSDDGWSNIVYPRYGVTLHLTAIEFDSEEAFEKALDNRLERMALNIGAEAASDSLFFNRNGMEALTLTCYEGILTPIQFVSVDKPRRLLSGTVVMGGNTKPADSAAYIVRYINVEVDTLLQSLKCVEKQ